MTQFSHAPVQSRDLAPEPLVALRGIQKVYTTEEVETHALRGVDLDIREGDFIAIAGPSGCGKSTLLSLIGLLDLPSSGEYYLAGECVSDLSPSRRAQVRNCRIGFIFQSFNLIGDLTVLENVVLPLTYRTGAATLSVAQQRSWALDALERVGMMHRVKHYPSQLSGGQQQRVAVARAVAGQPKLLLADEPTGNLDSVNGHAVMELLRELHLGGATICMVTHDSRYAEHATRTVRLKDGSISEVAL